MLLERGVTVVGIGARRHPSIVIMGSSHTSLRNSPERSLRLRPHSDPDVLKAVPRPRLDKKGARRLSVSVISWEEAEASHSARQADFASEKALPNIVRTWPIR